MVTAIGWPESLAWLMWPGGETQADMSWIRENYDYEPCPVDITAMSLETFLEANAGERRDGNGKPVRWEEAFDEEHEEIPPNPRIDPPPVMTSAEARSLLSRMLVSGERNAEGRASQGGLPEPIPPSAWRGCDVVVGAEGFDLKHRASGRVLYHDVWIVGEAPEPQKPNSELIADTAGCAWAKRSVPPDQQRLHQFFEAIPQLMPGGRKPATRTAMAETYRAWLAKNHKSAKPLRRTAFEKHLDRYLTGWRVQGRRWVLPQ